MNWAAFIVFEVVGMAVLAPFVVIVCRWMLAHPLSLVITYFALAALELAAGLGGEGWWYFTFAAFFLFWGVLWAINRKAWRYRPGRKRPLDDFPVPYRAIWRWHKRRHA